MVDKKNQCVSEFTFTLDFEDKHRKEKPFMRFRCMREKHFNDGQHRHWGITPEKINYEVSWDAD